MKPDNPTKPDSTDAHRDAANQNRRHPFSRHDLCAYVDGELPMAKRRALELHLATDDEMQSKLVVLAQLRTLVRLAYGAKKADD